MQSLINSRDKPFVKSNEFLIYLLHTFALSLCHSKVFLLPPTLARKRVWNPKYPICIQVARDKTSLEEEGGKSDEEPEAKPANPKQRSSKHSHDSPVTLYLFGRTGREKEEWFRHFLFASMDTEREREGDRQRPGRCLSRSGMRYVYNALEKRRPPDKASIQMLYMCGLWVTCSNSCKANPFQGNTQTS